MHMQHEKIQPTLKQIIVEGGTDSKTRYDAARGVITLVLTNEGGLYYETNLEEDGKVLRATPAIINDGTKEKQ